MGDGLFGGILGGVTDLLNFGEQKKQNEWMKLAQEETWRREDSAVQRRTADLEAAGFNKLLAAGGAAQTSSPIQVGAPQLGTNSIDKAALAVAMMKQKADISKTDADTQLSRINYDLAKDQQQVIREQLKEKQEAVKALQIANARNAYDNRLIFQSGMRSDVRSIATEVDQIVNGLEKLFTSQRGGVFMSAAKGAAGGLAGNLWQGVKNIVTAPGRAGTPAFNQFNEEQRLLEEAKKIKPRGDGRIR